MNFFKSNLHLSQHKCVFISNIPNVQVRKSILYCAVAQLSKHWNDQNYRDSTKNMKRKQSATMNEERRQDKNRNALILPHGESKSTQSPVVGAVDNNWPTQTNELFVLYWRYSLYILKLFLKYFRTLNQRIECPPSQWSRLLGCLHFRYFSAPMSGHNRKVKKFVFKLQMITHFYRK